MPDDKKQPKSKQTFCAGLRIRTPLDAPKNYTEAAVRKWLERQLKDCPFGPLVLGDVIEMSNPD